MVRLFLKYISKGLKEHQTQHFICSLFPSTTNQSGIYSRKPVGHIKLATTVKNCVRKLVWLVTKQTTLSKGLLQQDSFRQGVMSSSLWMSQDTEVQMVYGTTRRFLLSSTRLLLELSRIPTRRESTKHKSQSQIELHAQLCRMLRSPSASVVTSKASLSTFKARIRSSGSWQLLTWTLDWNCNQLPMFLWFESFRAIRAHELDKSPRLIKLTYQPVVRLISDYSTRPHQKKHQRTVV